MAVIRPEKAAKVAEIKELLTASKCTILVDFCGLTVAQDTAFRRKMREAGVKYGVVKNTMLRIAANEAGIEGLEPVLEKNTAIAVAPEDPVAVAKIICDFAKENKALTIKAEQFKALALMPIGKKIKIPSRRMIGYHPRIREVIAGAVDNNLKELNDIIFNKLKP